MHKGLYQKQQMPQKYHDGNESPSLINRIGKSFFYIMFKKCLMFNVNMFK